MKRNKIIICILTAALLVGAVFIAVYQITNTAALPFSFEINSDSETERIKCWENKDGESFVFLPSFLELADVKINLNTDSKVLINGVELLNDMPCDSFSLDTEYDLTYKSFGIAHKGKITFIRSDNVHTVYIDTESEKMDYIHSNKGNSEKGKIRVYDSSGKLDFKGDLSEISGRGNSTWEKNDKKPYNLSLLNDVDLLSMGKAKEWILLANAFDESNIRNKLVYDFSRLVGLSAPECEHVDLYLNGEYAGLYLLCERNEIGETRLNISREKSFLVSMDRYNRFIEKDVPHILTENGQALRIHSSYLAEKALAQKWQSVENAILSEDGIDDITGKHWRDLIDTDSWAKKYLIEEIFGNFDACFTSQYFYCDMGSENNKIFAGPVWDYDLSIGFKDTWQIATPNILIANRPNIGNGYETPWFHSLYNQDEFKNTFINLYKQIFQPELQEYVKNDLSNNIKNISQASRLNSLRWEYADAVIEVDKICDFLEKRLAFLNEIWVNKTDYCTVRFISSASDYDGFCIAFNGQALSEVPISIGDEDYPEFCGWYHTDTDEPFDIEKPIYEDTVVYAKWQDNNANSFGKLLKLIPIAVIAVIFLALVFTEIKRIKGRG